MASAIVAGAGVFGTALADRLAGAGWEVTLVDRFGPGDPRAESGGETRLIRCAHGPDELYARSARRALKLWRELDPSVLVECGMTWFARGEAPWEAASERVMRGLGIPCERLEPGEAGRLFPSLQAADLAYVVFEPNAGVLRAGDATKALARRSAERGCRLRLGSARPDGGALVLDGERLEADVVIWACGAWLASLFPGLVRLRVTCQDVVLFQAPPEWRSPAVPAWLDFETTFYGHGLIEPHGFKVAADRLGESLDPDARPREASGESVRLARDYLEHRFPALAGTPVASTTVCHYSLTADSSFIFARHPEHPSVWLLGGGSGHGFKHGPALAEHAEAVISGRAEPEPRFALGERAPSHSLRSAAVT